MKEISPDKWIPDDKYRKICWGTRRQIEAFLGEYLTMYGYQNDIFVIAEGLMYYVELFGEVVRGRDIPIMAEVVKYRRRKGKK